MGKVVPHDKRWRGAVGGLALSVILEVLLLSASLDAAERPAVQSWDGSGFRIEVASERTQEAIPLKVTLPQSAVLHGIMKEHMVFLLFQGLPADAELSEGFRVNDHWIVSLSDVGRLSLKRRPQSSGSFELSATLRVGDANAARSSVIIDLTPLASAASPASLLPLASAPPLPIRRPRGVDETVMLDRCRDLINKGDFEAARLILTDLTERGSAQAAFNLAQTYDPRFLKSYFVVGIKPDVELAKHWYHKAAELGGPGVVESANATK